MRKCWLSAALVAALCLTLAACGSSEDKSAESSGGGSISEEPAVSAMAPVEPEPEPEPEPEFPYTNPLTGEGLEEDVSQKRPIAIMINNHKKALPQLGVAQADVIYEMVAEGGITRMMAVFQSVEDVGNIGSVRSARDYYVSLAYGHDAIFLHAGGSDQAYISIKKWGVTALDCVNGPYEGTLYWRDAERRKNAGLEHSVLTSGNTIQELLPTYKRVTMTHKDGFALDWSFGGTFEGEAANTITVPFSNYKTGQFHYDEESGQYRVEQHGKAYVDGNTGEQVAVKNVLVLLTEVEAVKGDNKGRQSIRTTGEGEGYLFRDGAGQAITWKRADKSDTLSFFYKDGTAAQLGVGASYINIVDSDTAVTWS